MNSVTPETRERLGSNDLPGSGTVEVTGASNVEGMRSQLHVSVLGVSDPNQNDGANPAESTALQSFEFTPKMADEAIAALRAEFDKGAQGAKEAGYLVQEGIAFSAVEAKLRAAENKPVLVSLYRMVQAGSRPAVVCAENGRYCIAETFGRTLAARANCVYDKEAEDRVGRDNCNGNAVDQAKEMGVPLMERSIADAHLTRFPDADQYCYDYIQAAEDELKDGFAPCVCRGGGKAVVVLYVARDHDDDLQGWRGALWV
ncbi:hypothetical protein A3A67_00610 [Candidatus Peribacteria bacterium RIFCSPLOWO2_01_FULL_51_18]|nr:MAG: hypothetical protein A3C52_04935 [Candidatus Peribacteria bacterium RIFCSPHIGHO2_02_FULL_51_15]OGJ64962.1 MAG: hypothetical protein A3A67_00610 [Candidatus Peribacteria bacterium RIFCSPLOWO2_01_FULL_51_18]OGJ69509.1 MAG: hypothetical protein A3J34_02675 [Candidatus Peribacteria bacterium RIFCSPLOWO2_02_FULL_51_10]